MKVLITIYKKKWLLLFLTIFCCFSCQKNTKKVPIISSNLITYKKQIDSLQFLNQFNNTFQPTSLKGKVHLVNFFFTTCTTICPRMDFQLDKIAKKYDDIQLISFTIDPDKDNISVLKKYAERNKNSNQLFLRGSKTTVIKIAKYYLNEIENSKDDYFYHTSYVALLDKKMMIRGLYDSLDKDDLKFMEEDILILLNE